MLDESLRPVPKKDVDYKSLPIHPTPEEYYLLSRVTGTATIGEICAISSMGHDQTIHALERLEQAGLIEIPRQAPQPQQVARPQPAPQPAPQPQPTPQPTTPQPAASDSSSDTLYAYFPVSMTAYAYDAQILGDASIELEEQARKELMYVFGHLEQIDYYQLFSLSREASRKDVRNAFFALSKRFHPDLFYGKALGPLAEMAEAIFLKVNKAQQILSHKKKRAEYDQGLGPEQGPRSGGSSTAASISEPQVDAGPQEVLDPAERKKRDMAFTVLVRRGEKCETAGDLVAAAAEYKKAFGVKRDSTVALRAANLLLRSGHEHYEQAILLAMAAYKEDRSNASPLMLIGDAYEELGRLDDAARYYNKILSVDPNNKVAQQRLRYVEAQR